MLFINVLTLQYKKVSQSVTILGHLFHYDFLVNVALDSKAVHRNEEEIAYYFKAGWRYSFYRNGPCSINVFYLHHYKCTRRQCQVLDDLMSVFVIFGQKMTNISLSAII